MVTLAIAAVVALVGLVVYVLASNAKAQEIGRILFFAGVLALLLLFGGRAIHL